MAESNDFTWTEQEMKSILIIADWYAEIAHRRGLERPDHPLRALLGIAMETYLSSRRFDEMAEVSDQAQLDEDTLASLTADPATAVELAAICGVLAGTLGVNSGIMDDADLHDYRVRTVQSVLAQVRLRNSTEHLGSGYVQ